VLDSTSTVAIAGGSLAGLRAAEALRSDGYQGRIVMIGAERHLPYDRPPLSKQFLAGKWGLDRLKLRDPEKIEEGKIEFRLGLRACALDVAGHRLDLEDGGALEYDGLVIVTGSHPRQLPGTENVPGVHTLRTIEDSIALHEVIGAGTRVVVVGAGFIGSEVAATCHGRGAHVTVVEALAVPLERALGKEMGKACSLLHEDNGVELRTGVGVSQVRKGEVELEDGTELQADVVVVGIGVIPTTDWLEGSGLETRDGVVADATLHASDDIVVAGDLARWFDERLGKEIRIEHWTNASDQGRAAGRSLLAGRSDAKPYVPVPYFWSDQYDVKIQMLGHPEPDDEVVVVEGSLDERRFVALYGRDGNLTGALGFSRPRQLMKFHPLLENGASFSEALALKTD
jgi:NADPH-dependent 2,4-dienoyl-CoA reductase/sulfur reductase-like enzyme